MISVTRPDQSQASIVRILPVEMIREIFLLCLPQGQFGINQCQLPPTPTEPRLVLAHVCSAWREVAFRMPGMWTDILCREIIDLGTTEAKLRQLLFLPAGTLPNLETIQLYEMENLSEAGIDLFNHGQITAFQGCPELRSYIPAFGYISATLCLDILRECVSLQDCRLSILPIDGITADRLCVLSNRPISLPSIHTLSLALVNHHTPFIAALRMPNLRLFRPLNRWYGFRWPPLPLEPFPQLNELDLVLARGLTEEDLSRFLHPLQRLTKLSISLSGTLIPSATSIAFRRVTQIEAIILLLEKRLVASRVAGSGITMFTLVYSDGIRPRANSAVVSRLEALEATGVHVEFNYVE
ncbi:hypothetical protein BD779DRAFT_1584286 [Infundibulicybe gibba]|nr:hypothetical protein BD779DRAFT_1584286 [Infundibulicybe gibba]